MHKRNCRSNWRSFKCWALLNEPSPILFTGLLLYLL